MNKKTKIIIAIISAIILVLAGYFVALRAISRRESYKNLPTGSAQPELINKLKTDGSFSAKGGPALGWKLYKNSNFGFEIQYPETWSVSEEEIENIRGEKTKGFFFKNPNSDLRFAILPRDGLSYGVGAKGTSTPVYIGGFPGVQTQYILKDGRRLWLLFPQYGLYNWLQDLGRIDAMTSVENPLGDTQIFEKMLNSFKLVQ